MFLKPCISFFFVVNYDNAMHSSYFVSTIYSIRHTEATYSNCIGNYTLLIHYSEILRTDYIGASSTLQKLSWLSKIESNSFDWLLAPNLNPSIQVIYRRYFLQNTFSFIMSYTNLHNRHRVPPNSAAPSATGSRKYQAQEE